VRFQVTGRGLYTVRPYWRACMRVICCTGAGGVRVSPTCGAAPRACVSAGSTAATGGNISCTSALTATSVDQLDVATADDALRSSPARRGRRVGRAAQPSYVTAARPGGALCSAPVQALALPTHAGLCLRAKALGGFVAPLGLMMKILAAGMPTVR